MKEDRIFSAFSFSEEEYAFQLLELDVQDSVQSKVYENEYLKFEHFLSI